MYVYLLRFYCLRFSRNKLVLFRNPAFSLRAVTFQPSGELVGVRRGLLFYLQLMFKAQMLHGYGRAAL